MRLSILPREAEEKSVTKVSWQLKQWKAYLLAGLEAFADVQPCSLEDSYSVFGRHVIEAIPAKSDSLRLLQLHHIKVEATSAGGLTTISGIQSNKLP